MEKYYNNIGTKIKEYAKFTGIIGGVISIITGFVVEAVLEFEFCGLCILAGVVSAIVNYVYSWFLYAFGQIT
ncbi:MAG: hypothetical protein Q4B31_04885, partial [Clostridia bacterium]|nr:hypothetical protein [Clostridia bacterium]